MARKTPIVVIVASLATMMLIGCQQATPPAPPPSPMPLPTDTPQPTATFTPTPEPTDTPVPTPIPITSSFDGADTAGWRVSPGKVTNPGEGGNSGGENDGHLEVKAPGDNRTSYYIAPPNFYGDWTAYSELSVDLWSHGGPDYTSGHGARGDIYLANGNMTAQRLLPYGPPENWETFVVPLTDDEQWTFGGGATSLADVLRNVTDFEIRAEYRRGAERDSSGLDNVGLR
jgi:hypothetical protein